MEKPKQRVQADKQRPSPVDVEVFEWAEACIVAVVAFVLLFVFVIRTARVFGESMEPTLEEPQRLLVWQLGYHVPQYEDIVIIDRSLTMEDPIIKRVIGKAGDVIDIDFDTGEVTRNGEVLEESYINEPTWTSYDVTFPVEVPEGHIFVLGDNRNHSSDSRLGSIGMVDLRNVMGKAIFRFLPLDEMGVLQ